MRSLGRRLRSSFGIGSSRMAIRSQMAWYWRWLLNVLLMVLVATVVWWLVQNSYRITGSDIEEVRAHIERLTEQDKQMKSELDSTKAALLERDRQLQIEKDGKPNEYRYRMLLTQGGQRKQDFKGKVQIVAHVANDGGQNTITYPEAAAGDAAGSVEFRFYQKVEGRFSIPEGSTLKSADVRVLAMPGGQVKLSRTINQL